MHEMNAATLPTRLVGGIPQGGMAVCRLHSDQYFAPGRLPHGAASYCRHHAPARRASQVEPLVLAVATLAPDRRSPGQPTSVEGHERGQRDLGAVLARESNDPRAGQGAGAPRLMGPLQGGAMTDRRARGSRATEPRPKGRECGPSHSGRRPQRPADAVCRTSRRDQRAIRCTVRLTEAEAVASVGSRGDSLPRRECWGIAARGGGLVCAGPLSLVEDGGVTQCGGRTEACHGDPGGSGCGGRCAPLGGRGWLRSRCVAFSVVRSCSSSPWARSW